MLPKVRFFNALLVLLVSCAAALVAQTNLKDSQGKAPVPPQIAVAKKVFISYTGTDSVSIAGFKWVSGDPDQPYNQFYAAMKSWGRYELTSTPADAELVFEIRFLTAIVGDGKVTAQAPEWILTIDGKTHFTLWTLTEPVKGANRKATWKKNIDESFSNLMDHLKQLASSQQSGGQ